MKAFTDLEQSKKLAEILPLESADMYYNPRPSKEIPYVGNANTALLQVTCWSLAALIEVLPKNYGRYTKSLYWFDDGWHCEYVDEDGEGYVGETADKPVDACYETILKLKELKLL